MIASGGGWRPRTAWRTSSSEETIAGSKPACSRFALMRTACSRSSMVMRTRSAMNVRRAWCVVRGVRAGEQIHGVIEELLQHRQAVFHAVRRAGKIDDQRLAARSGAAAGEPGAGKAGSRRGADRFGDAGGFALEHGGGCFGSHVALGEPGAAGREHDVHLIRVGPPDELAGDAVGLVGDDAAYDDFIATLAGPFENGVTGRIGSLAYGTQVGDSQDAN